jgi:hypothetical protein
MDAPKAVTATFDVPSLRIGDASVTEGDTGTASVDFTVSLSIPVNVPVTVDWASVDGSATAGSDYTAASGTISFPPGTTSQSVSLFALGDFDHERDEAFFVTLSNPAFGTIDDAQGRALILDDDVSPGSFYTLVPCRVLDTRYPDGTYGGPALVAGTARVVRLVGRCDIPETAKAVSVNVAVTQPTGAGNLRLYAAASLVPTVSAITYSAGQTRSNNAIVTLNDAGELEMWCAQAPGTAHIILDVTGYFE